MEKVVFFEKLRALARLTELAMRSRVMRSGKILTVKTSGRPSAMGGFPKRISIVDPKTDSSLQVTKKNARLAHVDMLDSPDKMHGTTANAGSIKSLIPVLRNFKKNKIDVEYYPTALSSSSRKGAVKDTAVLNGHYQSIAKKLGFNPEEVPSKWGAGESDYILKA